MCATLLDALELHVPGSREHADGTAAYGFAAAVELDPSNDYAHFGLGLCRAKTGDRSGASLLKCGAPISEACWRARIAAASRPSRYGTGSGS